MTPLDRPQSRSIRPWSGALSVVATVAALVVAAWHLRYPIEALTMLARGGQWVHPLLPISYGRAAVWLVVGLAAALGWRILAALAAAGAVVGEVVLALTANPPVYLPDLVWRWVPDVAAAGLLVAALATGIGLRRFAPVGRVLLLVGVLVLALSATAIPLLGEYPAEGVGSGFTYSFAIRSNVAAAVDGLTVLLTVALVAASTIGLDPAVRRRALAVLAAGTAYLVVERLAGPRFGFSSYRSPDPRVVAGLAAVVVVGLGLAWIAVRERLWPRAGSMVEQG